MNAPFSKSWWVDHGVLLAGCYPGSKDPDEATDKLTLLLDAGIRRVISLQEPGETGRGGEPFAGYEDQFKRLASDVGCEVDCMNFPVPDYGVPTLEVMAQIVRAIEESIESTKPAYVHCWGGHGRTATAIGCWLVSRGMSAEEALNRISELRQDDPLLQDEPAPQTSAQRDMVRTWRSQD